MDIVKIVAIAIVCALLCAVLKQYKPEFAIVVQLAASVFILLLIASAMGDLISAVKDLINGSGINTEYLTLLLKALGVSVLTQLAADACRDSGETALSNKVELAGKVPKLITFSATPVAFRPNQTTITAGTEKSKLPICVERPNISLKILPLPLV